MLSDDEGDTWRKSEVHIDLPMRGAMEASVAELLDGELVLSLRTPLALALSQDRGQSWTRLGNVAQRDEFNFFDIGCDFFDDEMAILTYGFYGPNDYENNLPDQEWHDPEVMDLHAVHLTKAWIYARLAKVQGG